MPQYLYPAFVLGVLALLFNDSIAPKPTAPEISPRALLGDSQRDIKDNCNSPNIQNTTQVLDHGLITSDFDALRFRAAASLQLIDQKDSHAGLALTSKLISSPYNEPAHLLDLRQLELPHNLVAQALTTLKPVRHDYSTVDYMDAFNWDVVLSTLQQLSANADFQWRAMDFYVVIFRSKLKPDYNRSRIHDLDKNSHREASESGGLLKYWFGSVNGEMRNLATCIWRNPEDARRGGEGPWHAKARKEAKYIYDFIRFSTWRLTIEDNATAARIEEWDNRRPMLISQQ